MRCDTIEIHQDAIEKGENILIIDDLLATGGTVKANIELVEKLGGNVVGLGFLIELDYLDGRKVIRQQIRCVFADSNKNHKCVRYFVFGLGVRRHN